MKKFNDPSVLRSLNHIRSKANEVNVRVTEAYNAQLCLYYNIRVLSPRRVNPCLPSTSNLTRRD